MSTVRGGWVDNLAGLPGRQALLARLSAALSERGNGGVVVVFLDVDRLGTVNEVFGYDVGDRLLSEVARRLSAAVRPSDLVARIGGDNFAIACHADQGVDAHALGERLLGIVASPFALHGGELHNSASIGVTLAEDASVPPAQLLSEAEGAMHRAKGAGGNRVEVFEAGMRHRGRKQLEIEGALRAAANNDEFRLHYQPIIDLRDGRVSALEALLRWERPGFGTVMPGDFVGVAERIGLTRALSRWTLDQVRQHLQEWRAAGVIQSPSLTMWVNVSAGQLSDRGLVDTVGAAVEAFLPDGVGLEITEGAVVEKDALPVLDALRKAGTKLAVDDFGTGYSSLAYLKHLPVDVLKIDRSFVAGVDEAVGDRVICQAAIAVARVFGLEVVGEGVETASQLDVLRELGCDRAQGYLFSRAVAAGTMTQLLERWGADSGRGPWSGPWRVEP